MRGSAVAGLLLALSTALVDAGARADTRRIEDVLTIEHPSCLAPASLARAIAAFRKGDRVDARLRIVVSESDPRGAHFVLRRDGEVLGERTIEAADASCDELREALALTLAVSIDALPPAAALPPAPEATLPRSPDGPNAPPSSTAPAAPAPGPSPPLAALHVPAAPGDTRATRRRRELPVAFEVGVEGGLALDLVPARVGALSATAGLRIGRRNARLGGLIRAGLLVTGAGTFTLGAGAAEARLAAGRLDGCVWFQPGRFGLDGCVGVAAGRLAAHGSGFDHDAGSAAPWASITGRLAGRLSVVPALALTAGVEGFVPVLAPRVEVENLTHETVAQVPVAQIGVGLVAGVVATFP